MNRETIDFIKGLSILAVVLLHTFSVIYGYLPQNSVQSDLFITIDQILRFCVPAFVAFSGYALASKYAHSVLDISDFFRKRVLRLLPLYFLWTGIYFFTSKLIPGWNEYIDSFPLWEVIFWGRAEFHLYFVPMIFQLYIFFPLLFTAVLKHPKLTLSIVAVFQLIALSFINQPGWNDQAQYVLSVTWIYYFVLGIYLALTKMKIPTFVWLLLLFIGLFLTLESCFHIWRTQHDLILATRFTKFPVFVYATGVILLFSNFKKSINPVVAFMGKHSYTIFLSHVLFLHIAQYLLQILSV